MLLERDFGLKIAHNTLREFYLRNGIRYGAVGYIYCQALSRDPSAIQDFAYKLAKVVAAGKPLVYFDEASFNLWLRNRKTWSTRENPIKYPLGKLRGKGITVMGAISQGLKKPVFTLEDSTNAVAFMSFLKILRRRFTGPGARRVTIVLDNHKAHRNPAAR